MSKILFTVHRPDGSPVHLDGGFDQLLNTYYLDVYDETQDDPIYESMSVHEQGLHYTLDDLRADVQRLTGRAHPEFVDAICSNKGNVCLDLNLDCAPPPMSA